MTTCPSSADFIASSPRFPCSKTISYELAIRACLGCHKYTDHCSPVCRNNSLADHWFEQELSRCSLTKSGSFFMAGPAKGRMRSETLSVSPGNRSIRLLNRSSSPRHPNAPAVLYTVRMRPLGQMRGATRASAIVNRESRVCRQATAGQPEYLLTHQAVIVPPRSDAQAHAYKSSSSKHPNVRAALALCVCLRPPRANA